jgi:hypothetical protein
MYQFNGEGNSEFCPTNYARVSDGSLNNKRFFLKEHYSIILCNENAVKVKGDITMYYLDPILIFNH